MTQKNAGNIKYLLSALTLCLVAQQSITSQASASMITGVKPEDVGGHNQYNITPEGLMGDKDIGFKTYGHFTLDEGDIANLIFNYYGKDVSMQTDSSITGRCSLYHRKVWLSELPEF